MANIVPQTFRRIMVNQLSHKFREVASIIEVKKPTLKPTEVLVKNKFLGINASDVNFSAGRYDPSVKLPFACGFEAVGEVVEKGPDAKLSVNQPVAYIVNGAFAEYHVINEKQAIPVPAVRREYVPLLISGLTAGIALESVGQMKFGETVLVTAAAGGTGQFAVQLAKLAGCHVIGTCSSESKIELLRGLGCDRPVNYNKEDLSEVLKSEYPKGVDVIYESVGGIMFDTCVNALARHGRLIVIGYISGYQSDRGFTISRTLATLPQRLLPKSASVRGFFLFNHPHEIKPMAGKLFKLADGGQLKALVDTGSGSSTGPFIGLDSVYNAVDHLYTKQSVGKIIVELPDSPSSKL